MCITRRKGSKTGESGIIPLGTQNTLTRCVLFIYKRFIKCDQCFATQNEVYDVDDWEVKREHIKMLEELGKGSFGLVYRGLFSHPTNVSCHIFPPGSSHSSFSRVTCRALSRQSTRSQVIDKG